MKKFYILLTFVCIANQLFAQTVYNITKDEKTSDDPFPSNCTNCQIIIADNVTLTVNSDIYLSNSSFSGGEIIVKNKDLTFWSNGQFNNTTLSFTNGARLVSSGLITMTNTVAVFNNTSRAIVYSSFQLNASRMKFLNNSRMEATGGNFNLMNSSAIIVGDGTTGSRSNVRFNGATLYQYDQSFITLANYNNYYFNWGNYSTLPNGLSFSILNNNLNCGPGKNPCANPNLYGPSTLTIGGIVSSATLPVKLSDFSLRPAQTSVLVKWKTDMESNSDKFIVQRSSDGVYWQNAGEVKAKGNSTVVNEYSFNDTRPGGPLLYYRLKMMDIDKQYEFSPIKSTTLGVQNALVIFPNPARDYFTITSGSSSDRINGVLLSDQGMLLKKIEGTNPVRIDLTGFAPGSYFIKVTTDSLDYSNFKLIVNR